jgi:hypothetical protein
MLRHGLFLIIIFLLFTLPNQAQVAVNTDGTSPEDCAILDINAADKGVLFPRVSISDLDTQTPIEGIMIDGLIVYNITETDGIQKGFYFWRESKWNLIKDGSSILTINEQMQMYEAAELYEDNELSSPSTINLQNSNNYYGWVEAEQGETFGSTTTDLENLIADKIIVGQDGLFKIEFCLSFAGSNNFQLEAAIFHTPLATGVAEVTRIRSFRKLAALDIGSGSAHGLIRLHQGDAIDIRFKPSAWGESISLYNINLIVNKVGEL